MFRASYAKSTRVWVSGQLIVVVVVALDRLIIGLAPRRTRRWCVSAAHHVIDVALAHARQKFHGAQGTDPERVLPAKAWIRKLYDVEDEAKHLSSAERLRLRQEKSVPLLASLGDWLRSQGSQVLPKSPIAAAMNYVWNQWEALNR